MKIINYYLIKRNLNIKNKIEKILKNYIKNSNNIKIIKKSQESIKLKNKLINYNFYLIININIIFNYKILILIKLIMNYNKIILLMLLYM